MALDTHTGLEESMLQDSGGHKRYHQHLDDIHKEVERIVPKGTIFSVGSLGDGTGHGNSHVWIQGEQHQAVQAALKERFPSTIVESLTMGHYESLLRDRENRPDKQIQREQVAKVEEEVARACEPTGVLFDLRVIACEVGGRIAVVVHVEGRHRKELEAWLIGVFGTGEGHDISVHSLTADRYHELNRRRNGRKPLVSAAGSM